jgi:hypothetical protein
MWPIRSLHVAVSQFTATHLHSYIEQTETFLDGCSDMKLRFSNLGVTTAIITFLLAGTANAFLAGGIGSGCAKESIPGQWQHTKDGMVWEFLESGMLNCKGVCDYKGGKPVAWSASGVYKSTNGLAIYLTSEKVSAGCSMAANNLIMNLIGFGTFRRIKSAP